MAEFAKLADDPVKAVVALNEKYHFLTAAVFSQIHALQEQGDTLGAQQVAEGAYADALTKRAEEIQRNLGYVERAWDSAKGAAKGAWDAFLDIGREETFEDKLRQLEQRANIGAGGLGGGLLSGFEASQGSKAEIGKEWTGVLQQEVDDQARARAAMFEAEAVERGTKAYQALQKAIDSTAPKSEKLKKALDDNRRQIEEARRAGYTITADQEAALEAQTKAKFKPTAGRSSAVDLSSFNDQKNALNSILSEYKNSQKELDAAQKAGLISQEEYAAQRAAIIQQQKAEVTNAYEAEIKALEEAKGRSSTSAQQRIQLDQKIADARAAMVKAQKDADTELSVLATNEQGRLKKQAMAVQTYTDALDQQVKALRLQGQRAAVGVGLGDRQRTLQDQQNGITDQINQQRRTLADQYGDGSRGMSLDEYNKKLAALQRTEDDLHQTAIRNYDDLTVAQSDWSAGASAAWQNYQNQALNVAGQMQSAFTSLYDGLTDAAVEWAFGAEETFGDVAVSFAKMLAKMAVQAAASNVFSSILGTVGTSLIGAGAGAAASAGSAGAGGFDFGLGGASSGMTYTPTFSDGGFTGPGGKYEPAGIVHGGEFVLRKEVVSQPGMLDWLETLNTRGYADGGLVGSFTPQAIPRQISSASGSNPVVIQQEITVEGGGGQASASTNDMGAVAQAYAKAAKDGAQQEIAKQLKRGGMIWTAINRPVR
ncbi:hypothetical protein GLGCALEP_03421 [Pseudomonas sp. MM221]|nr:hypothetical protein DBADOPDK_03347 [Pseudomonas sp. MM223]CAI3804170.1 hypothetical protein GLGCALEP_03421 [Pseudomonas sp. MM221]